MYTIFAALQSERAIQFNVERSNDPHPYTGQLQDTIWYSDLYAFGIAMGLPAAQIPPGYAGSESSVRMYEPHPFRNRLYRVAPGNWNPEDPDPLFELIKQNLALCTQFIAWRLSYRSFRNVRQRLPDAAASSVIMSAGADEQNVDWIIDMTKERAVTIGLPSGGGGFSEIRLQLPEGMVGKVCESYKPPELVARSLMSGLNSIRRNAMAVINRQRSEILRAKAEAYKDAVNAISAILSAPGWSIRDNRLVYTNRISVKNVLYEGVLLDLPPQLVDELYLTEISVGISSTIRDVRGMGFHPHLATSFTDEMADLCAGDLFDAPIAKVVELPRAMETAYYESMYGYRATSLIEYLFGPGFRARNAEKYPGLEEYLINKYRDGKVDGEVFGSYDD